MTKRCQSVSKSQETYPKVVLTAIFSSRDENYLNPKVPMLQSDLPIVLEKLKSDPKFRDALLDNLLTQEEWSAVLGIDRRNLWRWRVNIIDAVSPLKASYYEKRGGARSNYLDAYQRFLFALIYVLKGEEIKRGIKNNNDVIRFLKSNFMHLRRSNFEQWQENNNVY